MRFFIDECCPVPLADALRDYGHDVLHAMHESAARSDLEQADLAFRLDRILVSADYDFGTLAVRQQRQFVGLILIAPRQEGLLPFVSMIASQIHGLGAGLVGRLTMLEAERIRQRLIGL